MDSLDNLLLHNKMIVDCETGEVYFDPETDKDDPYQLETVFNHWIVKSVSEDKESVYVKLTWIE